jgi:hypothetical protein
MPGPSSRKTNLEQDELESDSPDEGTAHLMSKLTLTRDSLDIARGQKATNGFENRRKLQL